MGSLFNGTHICIFIDLLVLSLLILLIIFLWYFNCVSVLYFLVISFFSDHLFRLFYWFVSFKYTCLISSLSLYFNCLILSSFLVSLSIHIILFYPRRPQPCRPTTCVLVVGSRNLWDFRVGLIVNTDFVYLVVPNLALSFQWWRVSQLEVEMATATTQVVQGKHVAARRRSRRTAIIPVSLFPVDISMSCWVRRRDLHEGLWAWGLTFLRGWGRRGLPARGLIDV